MSDLSSTERVLLGDERRSHLLSLLQRDGAIRITTVSDELAVTPMTVRRDIERLERQGLAQRVYGGAVAVNIPVAAAGRGGDGVPSRPSTPTVPTTASARGTEAVPAAQVSPPQAVIGVLVPSFDHYWPAVVRGIEQEALRHGMRVVLHGSSYEAADERPVLETLINTDGLCGLLLAPRTLPSPSARLVEWLTNSPVPVVLMERESPHSQQGEPFEMVVSDHAQGTLVAVRHLAELGHRRVALVINRESPTSRKIAVGWRAACAELGLTNDEHFERLMPRLDAPVFTERVADIVDTAVKSGTTGIVIHSDNEALAVVNAARDRGLSVPDDLSVIAYDDEVAGLFTPALTAVSPAREAIGADAVDLLVKRLSSPSRPIHRVVVSPRLVVRETTGPAAGGG
ncbi:MAG: substrate-binding domain-containing protein [Cellulomonadaceae bacterium]|nr:substrate-binding domain-containing protein [Cellulomonadaceae bacterium]